MFQGRKKMHCREKLASLNISRIADLPLEGSQVSCIHIYFSAFWIISRVQIMLGGICF